MKPIDIKDLVNGLITLVILSIAIGQYGNLREFAKREFVKSLCAHKKKCAAKHGNPTVSRYHTTNP